MNDPRLSTITVNPLPGSANPSKIPATLNIVQLFLRELIVGKYYASSDPTIGHQMPLPYSSIQNTEDHTKLYGLATPTHSQVFTVSPSVVAEKRQRIWAGSDLATQAMIADWTRHAVISDTCEFQTSIYPFLTAEEKNCVENVMK